MQDRQIRKTRGPSLDEMMKAGERAEDVAIATTDDPVNRAQKIMMRGLERLCINLPDTVVWIIKERAWEGRYYKIKGDTFPITSFKELVEARLPWGLELTMDDLLFYCRKHKEATRLILEMALPAAGNVGAPEGNRNAAKSEENKGSITTIASAKDRGRKYVISRLKRDRPELAQKVISGEMTANEAAIEAGFRKRMVSMPADPAELIKAMQKRLKARVVVLDEQAEEVVISTASDPVAMADYMVEAMDTDWVEAFAKALGQALLARKRDAESV